MLYPAIDFTAPIDDQLYAALDDFSPTAIEERGTTIRAFFSSGAAREEAFAALAVDFDARRVDVPDEDWARRSQADLKPVTIGRITVTPPWLANPHPPNPQSLISNPCVIVIAPSMGFGTGHHASTRLCLAALQQIGVLNQRILDVGTGSGVLAIAASRLGASRATGIDIDPDAIQSARENLALNQPMSNVRFEIADLTAEALPEVDIVTANLTGALLIRSAARLSKAVRPGGIVIMSGLQTHDREAVLAAFDRSALVWEAGEDEWTGLAVKKP